VTLEQLVIRGSSPVYGDNGISDDRGSSLAKPHAHSGMRIEPEVAIVIPAGIYDDAGVNASFAPGIRLGHESPVRR